MIFAQKAIGLNPSPFDCWLISRGLKTLGIRMRQHAENALQLAEFLEDLDCTESVRYPFLQSASAIRYRQKKQMKGGSGIVTVRFNLPYQQVIRLVSGLKLFSLAESLGGIESLVCHPASMTPRVRSRKPNAKPWALPTDSSVSPSESKMPMT